MKELTNDDIRVVVGAGDNNAIDNNANVISVVSARYWTTSCGGAWCDAGSFVGSLCNGQVACGVEATDEICGDPCYGYYKALSVWYRCGNASRSVTAQEYTDAKLWC